MINEKRNDRVYERRVCICGEVFWVPKEGSAKHRRPSGVRPRSAKTCWFCGKGRDRLLKLEKNKKGKKL